MTTKQAIIELNGQRFNAITGNALYDYELPEDQRNIDGILPSKNSQSYFDEIATLAQDEMPLKEIVAMPTMSDVVRPKAARAEPKHMKAKKRQTAKTLMRSAVKKPSQPLKRSVRVRVAHTGSIQTIPVRGVAIKVSVKRIDPVKKERALTIPKSQAVKRFTPVPLHVPEPVNRRYSIPREMFATTPAPVHQVKHISIAQAAPAPEPVQAAQPAPAAKPAKPHKPVTATDLFAKALHSANSHKQPKLVKKKRMTTQALVIVVSFAAVLALTGVLASQNSNSVKMYLASTKAGFTAALPTYKPAGYHINTINSNSGQVMVSYLSNSGDGRAYNLTQKSSEWNSDTLREAFVLQQGKKYQTVQAGGKTVYLYGNHQATWVDGGVWYVIDGYGSLSEKQLVDLARSL